MSVADCKLTKVGPLLSDVSTLGSGGIPRQLQEVSGLGKTWVSGSGSGLYVVFAALTALTLPRISPVPILESFVYGRGSWHKKGNPSCSAFHMENLKLSPKPHKAYVAKWEILPVSSQDWEASGQSSVAFPGFNFRGSAL